MVRLERPLGGDYTMTRFVCYSATTENGPDFEASERAMSENCLLPLPPTPNYFFEMLDYEFRRAHRYKNAVTLMFIKLCHLEEIVGSYGQMTAERITSEIGRIIRSNIRDTDRGFMYGKYEFMIILPNTPKIGANHMIPKLKLLIEGYRYPNQRVTNINLSPKFGIASYPSHSEIIDGEDKLLQNTP
jgi:two-component system cell cycle response regulator